MHMRSTSEPLDDGLRYRALDGYRFVAALCVVIFHYNIDFHLQLEHVFPAIEGFGVMVDMFFLLSGFVIAKAYLRRMGGLADYRRFLHARLARIYPLHLLSLLASLCLLAVILAAHVPVNHMEMYALSALPANLLLLHAWGFTDHLSFNAASWSISAEWFVYLLTPLFFALARRFDFRTNLLVAAGSLAAIEALRHFAGLGPIWGANCDYGMLRAVPTFFLGVSLSVKIEQLPKRIAPPWWSVHGLFALAIAGLWLGVPYEAVIVIFALLIAGAAMAERRGDATFMSGRVMARLGDASYSLYMLHGLVAAPVLFVARRFGVTEGPLSYVAAIFAIAAVVGISVAVYSAVELPLRRHFGPRPATKGSADQPGLARLSALGEGAR